SGTAPLRDDVRRLRAVRIVAHRQPGPGRLPDGAAAPSLLAALVERGGDRLRHAALRARHLAVQPLPAVLGGRHRATRRLLFRLPGRVLRVGDATGAGGAPVAGATVS